MSRAMSADRPPRPVKRRRATAPLAQRGSRLSCPCCAPAEPGRPRPSLRLAGWLSRGANARAATDHPLSDSLFEDPQP